MDVREGSAWAGVGRALDRVAGNNSNNGSSDAVNGGGGCGSGRTSLDGGGSSGGNLSAAAAAGRNSPPPPPDSSSRPQEQQQQQRRKPFAARAAAAAMPLRRRLAGVGRALADAAAERLANIPLRVSLRVTRLSGPVVLWVPPPPGDRMWFSFVEPPALSVEARPVLGGRILRAGYGAAIGGRVSAWAAGKLRRALASNLVYPGCGDIKMEGVMASADSPFGLARLELPELPPTAAERARAKRAEKEREKLEKAEKEKEKAAAAAAAASSSTSAAAAAAAAAVASAEAIPAPSLSPLGDAATRASTAAAAAAAAATPPFAIGGREEGEEPPPPASPSTAAAAAAARDAETSAIANVFAPSPSPPLKATRVDAEDKQKAEPNGNGGAVPVRLESEESSPYVDAPSASAALGDVGGRTYGEDDRSTTAATTTDLIGFETDGDALHLRYSSILRGALSPSLSREVEAEEREEEAAE